MKNLIVLGMFVILSLAVVSCTCSREKKEQELSTWPQCSQEEVEKGTCGEKGEKKVKGPRKFKLSPQQLTINRELLNRAFNEQLKAEKVPPPQQQPAAPQKDTAANTPAEGQKPAGSPALQQQPKPMIPSNRIRIPVNNQPSRNTVAPEKGASR